MTHIKTVDVQIKAADAKTEGSFTGYASVFGNIDSYGDVVVAGAFADSLATYGEGGAGIPCYWRHRMDDPLMNIGVTTEAKEDDHGLFVAVQLDMDNPNAAYTHQLITEGRVTQMSFAFDVLEAGWAMYDGKEAFELRKLHIHEVSVVPVGANQETELIAAKARQEAAPASITEEDSGAKSEEPEAPAETGGNPAVVLAHTTLMSF